MKIAGYVAWILICKSCQFGNSRSATLTIRRYRNFNRGLFFIGVPCIV